MHELPAMSQGGFLQEMAVGSYDIHYSYLPLPDDDDDFLPGLHVDAEDANLGNMFDEQVKSEYDMGGEGDLFKAPEHFLVEAELELDPMATAMPIIYGGGDVITEIIKVASMESIQNDHLGGLFCECKKELLEESEIENSISELLDVKIPVVQIDEVPPLKDLSQEDGSMQKSISSGCLNSVEWVPGSTMRPEFFDFQELDFEAAFGLKRSYSEGDIGDLGTKNTRIGSTTAVCSSFEQLLTISDLKTEQRQLKLSRYREKKSKRNFGKKIKYACRKALADSQPRVRGRFAKTEECKHVHAASIEADKL